MKKLTIVYFNWEFPSNFIYGGHLWKIDEQLWEEFQKAKEDDDLGRQIEAGYRFRAHSSILYPCLN